MKTSAPLAKTKQTFFYFFQGELSNRSKLQEHRSVNNRQGAIPGDCSKWSPAASKTTGKQSKQCLSCLSLCLQNRKILGNVLADESQTASGQALAIGQWQQVQRSVRKTKIYPIVIMSEAGIQVQCCPVPTSSTLTLVQTQCRAWLMAPKHLLLEHQQDNLPFFSAFPF